MDKELSITSKIEGVNIVALRVISDEHGAVLHMLRCDAPDFVKFGECYFSEVFPGAIKAWKRHRAQTQNLAVPVGKIRLVLYDDRIGSSSYGEVQVFELGRPESYVRITIPPGLWYGFACIGKSQALIINCADLPHDFSECDRKEVSVSDIPYRWNSEGS